MKSISLKLKKSVFDETEQLLTHIDMSRNKYINEAIEYYNKHQQKKILVEKLAFESALITEDSMHVLKEFESMEDEM